jgi:hypothetical protein
VTQSGIENATFQLVAQCCNQQHNRHHFCTNGKYEKNIKMGFKLRVFDDTITF